ncbi:Vms1/Ankzf1 family peptidyl-tRNA hydrolase [uncultured Georgenia sp.]|uniref:baeRF2 domain-containing protein n=1 Tax=uncultured Georgenia sp. TaxID=378209 RepID=UPI002627FF72|nr:Vms1/Ankzf1 family peptidyl-tRNA hydrolase [uncultured Georgenia sp.]HLV03096.1 Vms1/Ankzf1 family peptidyl-tRNA hydrolase [Actinomycetaceae bacterium]
MQIDWLTSLVPPGDDVVTVTFDATRDTEHGYQAVMTRWRDLRRTLEGRGISARTLDHVEEQVRIPTHVAGKHGRAIVAGPDGVTIDRVLPEPPPDDTGVVGMDVSSLARVADGTVTYLLAEIDRTGADLTLQRRSALEYEAGDRQSVDGDQDVINKVRRAGMAQRRLQARAEDSWERNAETVAHELDRIVTERRPELLLLTGDIRAVALVRERLGAEAAALVDVLDGGSRSAGVNEQAFERKLHEALEVFRARRREEVLDRFRQEEGREGTATQSLADVVTALSRGQVAELIVRADATGRNSVLRLRSLWAGQNPLQIAPTPAVLADLGVAEPHEVRADLAIGRAAAEQGAGVTIVDEASIDLADGVGAILRWRDAATPKEHVYKASGDTARA